MTAPSLSLVDFARAERRKDCKPCGLPDDVRAQLRAASEKKISRDTQLRWLASIGYAGLTNDDMTVHTSGHHDSA